MKYFTVKELCVSGSYPKLVEVPKEGTNEYRNIVFLIENLLDPIREKLGRPVRVTSGYRPPKLNKAVGGSSTSNHLTGCAADIHTGNDSTDNIKIIEALLQLGYSYDEIIAEGAYFDKNDKLISAKWIHVALKPYNNRRKFLYTVDFKTYHQLRLNTVITK